MKSFIIRTLTAIVFLVCLCGCKTDVEYVSFSFLEYKNTTDHVIELYFEEVRNSCFFPDDCVKINPKGKVSTGLSAGMEGSGFEPLEVGSVRVVYDGKYEVWSRKGMTYQYDNLTDISVYEHSTKGKREEKYSYTFTEEDYNAAVSLSN